MNPPYYNPYDEQGNKLDVIPGLNRYSPDFLLKKQPSSSNRALFNGMVYVELSPLKGLKIRSQAGMEAYDWRSTAKRLPSYPSSLGNGQTTERFARNVMRTITNTIEYSFDINELHKFTVLAAHEGVDSKYQEFGSRTSGQNDDRLTMLESGTTAQLLSKDYNDDSLMLICLSLEESIIHSITNILLIFQYGMTLLPVSVKITGMRLFIPED